jgi:hypothetical protein
MYIIDKTVFLDITIGDNKTPFPIGTGNIEALHVIENINTVPQMQFVFKDVQGNLNKTISISDGTPLNIKIGRYDNQQNLQYYNFRVFSQHGPVPASGGQIYSLNCIIDSAKYIRGIVQQSFNGTSSQAISQIAAAAGLQFSGVPTNDSQAWLPSRCSYMQMARKIANHGYVDAQSYMRLGLTKANLVKYYNASALIGQKPKAALVMGDINQLPKNILQQVGNLAFVVFDYKPASQSGIRNFATGYGAKQQQQTLDGSNVDLTHVNATKLSNSFDINSAVYAAVDFVKSSYVPPDAGNSHPNYIQAGYQNQRIKAVFSNEIDVLLMTMSGLEIFDIVYLQLVDKTTRKVFTAYTGMYFVEAITGSVMGNRYYEKVRLVNTGKYLDPNGDNK